MLIEKLLKVALLGSSWVMYLLLILSVLSFGAMLERWWYFFRRRGDIDDLSEKLLAALEQGEDNEAHELLKKSRLVEASVLEPAIQDASGRARGASGRHRKRDGQGSSGHGTRLHVARNTR